MKYQTTTHAGVYSIFGGFLNTFNDVKVSDFVDTFNELTFGAIFVMLVPFIVGIVLMYYNEDNNDTDKTSGTSELRSNTSIKSDGS
jgi:MFS-type transporter involved in bile tolerance (Atg22 family)